MPLTHDKQAAPSPQTLKAVPVRRRARRVQWTLPEDLITRVNVLAARRRHTNSVELAEAVEDHLRKHGG